MKNEPHRRTADFYIGWQNNAPLSYARPVRRVVLLLFLVVPTLAGVLVWQQRGFSRGVFEYGTLRTVEGQLIRQPVPFLRVFAKNSPANAPVYKRLLLLGNGKHGAEATIQQWEQQHGPLTNRTLKINGTLIHYEGHAALELTNEAGAFLGLAQLPGVLPAPAMVPLGEISRQGEITDPKCFLGVMKPGDGRPHLSCAVRCISGGIPPMLWVREGLGRERGYLLVGPNGEAINQRILTEVGRQVSIRGRLEQADNWLILHVDAPVEVIATQSQPAHLDEQRAVTMCR